MDGLNTGATVTELAEPLDNQLATEPNEPINPATEPAQPVEPATSPVQDKETNAAFAQMRRESEQARRERDMAIAELYGQSHGITTWDQYQQAKAQAEADAKAQKMNIDPQFYQEFEGLKQKVTGYEAERQQLQREKLLIEQDKTLSSDPQVGELYTKYKEDVHTIAKSANCDYDIALTLLLRNKLPELINSTKSTAEQDAVKRLIQNGQSSPGSLSQGGTNQTSSISSMSKSDFAKLQEQVLRGERKQI